MSCALEAGEGAKELVVDAGGVCVRDNDVGDPETTADVLKEGMSKLGLGNLLSAWDVNCEFGEAVCDVEKKVVASSCGGQRADEVERYLLEWLLGEWERRLWCGWAGGRLDEMAFATGANVG